MDTTRPQHRQHQLYPQYQQGQHVRLPDGTHAHVLAQRGLTLWLRHHNDDTITTRPAHSVAPVGPLTARDQIFTSAHD